VDAPDSRSKNGAYCFSNQTSITRLAHWKGASC
jgi:hypothetical protein